MTAVIWNRNVVDNTILLKTSISDDGLTWIGNVVAGTGKTIGWSDGYFDRTGANAVKFWNGVATGTLTANLSGNVTGNVTGSVTAGNSDTVGWSDGYFARTAANAIKFWNGSAVGTLTSNLAGAVAAGLSDTVGWSDGYFTRTGANAAKFWNGSLTGTLTASLTGNVTGDLTGNVTGNVTGSSGSCTGNAATSSSCTGNAATATTLATARAINGVNFDGSAAITVTAAADTLTGSTLASGVTSSSLTTGGASWTVTGPIVDNASTNANSYLLARVSGLTKAFIGTTAAWGDGSGADMALGAAGVMYFYTSGSTTNSMSLDANGLVVTGSIGFGDAVFANGFVLTEHDKIGLQTPGVALLNHAGQVAAFIAADGTIYGRGVVSLAELR